MGAPSLVLVGREAAPIEPPGPWVAMPSTQLQIAFGGRAKARLVDIPGDLGQPAGRVRTVGTGEPAVEVLPPCAVVVLHVAEPVRRAHHRVEHAAIVGLPMPAVKAVDDLRRVERRRLSPVVGDFEAGKAPDCSWTDRRNSAERLARSQYSSSARTSASVSHVGIV